MPQLLSTLFAPLSASEKQRHCWLRIVGFISISMALGLSAAVAQTSQLRVLKTGLGDGTVTSNSGTLSCGFLCDETYNSTVTAVLTATAAPGSTFAGWSGACTNTSGTCSVSFSSGDKAAVAKFDTTASIPPLMASDFEPADLAQYLASNPQIDSPARFLAALPQVYRENWLLMSRSESLQTGTAEFPRILLPNADATRVFTIGMAESSSYPGAHPNAIEYMQWDATAKNFRFHEVILTAIPMKGAVPPRTRGLATDDYKCFACHSTGNIPNSTAFPGTTGVTAGTVQPRNKPNWDTYDSWGGLLPFNRDRIYQGSLEETAFRNLLNLWNWRGSASNDRSRKILEQLALQPSTVGSGTHAITRNLANVTDAGHLTLTFNSRAGQQFQDSTTYSFGASPVPSSAMTRDGSFLTLQVANSTNTDEGRATQLFDLLGGLDGDLNAQRVADELIDHRFATGSVPVDVRPMALAIAKGCIVYDSGTQQAKSTAASALAVDTAFFDARSDTLSTLVADTRSREESLPDRKARIQRVNLDRTGDIYLATGSTTPGLIAAHEPLPIDTSIQRIRQDVFKRPVDAGGGAVTVDGKYVDRENYNLSPLYNAEIVSLYRYFLEPLGVPVDSWSMSVRGRSRTYTFADVLSGYQSRLRIDLQADLAANPFPGLSNPPSCNQLVNAVNGQFSATSGNLPAITAVPTYTDVQRIFNRACIECHGGLSYPPFSRFTSTLDLSEIESPTGTQTRFSRAHSEASLRANLILQRVKNTSEDCPNGMMPCGGPPLSLTDIKTLERWVQGGSPRTAGDPHLHTVTGINYDFQAAGEFTLLRGENLEIQARQVPVPSMTPVGPDGYTGLTSCVSVNGAAAILMHGHRITYQPRLDGQPDPDALELRVDGTLLPLPATPLILGTVQIRRTPAPGGLQIDAIGGTSIIITPTFWHYQQIWYMNLDVRQARAARGMMGAIVPGSWLPALPDGSLIGPKPASLSDRYSDLYYTVGDAWRVTSESTLFDYAPGDGPWTFHIPSWPLGESPSSCEVPPPYYGDPTAQQPQQPLPFDVAADLCSGLLDEIRRENCIDDVVATGEESFAATYIATEQLAMNEAPSAPILIKPVDFAETPPEDGLFRWWPGEDPAGDLVVHAFCLWKDDEEPTFEHCYEVEDVEADEDGTLTFLADNLDSQGVYFWKILAQDAQGATSESETWRIGAIE